ncbi:MAG: DJ-1/PfpI family protein [Ruminococcaceae bacterium]|nr:DJ-1/PfpI family protein [Oscillospiraceae bacterium]
MVYIMLADGFEEVEALACCDILRRAEIKTYLASIDGEYVTGSHKITVKSDMAAKDIDFSQVEGLVLPGGMPGTLNLQKSEVVTELIRHCVENNKLIGAICAAPMILGDMGVLEGKKATCFPGFEENLTGAEVVNDFVVSDGNIITGKGAGASIMFGAAIADYFKEGAGKKLLKQVQHI